MSQVDSYPAAHAPREGRLEELGLLLLGLLFALGRFYRLGDWSLWIDEAYTLADSHHPAGNYNPLGYGLVRWTAEALGDPRDVFALRFAPALAGWLMVPLTWWALRPVAGGRRAAAAALLVALSSWQLYWSQNARFYTMAAIPSLVGLGTVVRGLGSNRSAPVLLGLGLAACGVAFHLQASLFVAAMLVGIAAHALATEEGEGRHEALLLLRRVLFVALIFGVLGGVWAFDVFARYMAVKSGDPLGSLVHLVRSTAFFLTPTLSLAAVVGGLMTLSRRTRRDREGRFLLFTLLAGGAAAALASLLAKGSAQYVFLFMPLVAGLAVWPLGWGPMGGAPLARTAYLSVLGGTLLAGSLLYFMAREGERPRWSEAYRYVADQRSEGDLILGMQAPVGEFYLAPGSTDLRRPRSVAWLSYFDPHAWTRRAHQGRPMWLVVRPDFLQEWPAQERSELQAFLREECRLRRRFEVRMEGRNLDVEVWHRP